MTRKWLRRGYRPLRWAGLVHWKALVSASAGAHQEQARAHPARQEVRPQCSGHHCPWLPDMATLGCHSDGHGSWPGQSHNHLLPGESSILGSFVEGGTEPGELSVTLFGLQFPVGSSWARSGSRLVSCFLGNLRGKRWSQEPAIGTWGQGDGAGPVAWLSLDI